MSGVISIRELKDEEWPIYSTLRLEALRDSPRMFGSKVDVEEKYTPQEWKDWLKPFRQAILRFLMAIHQSDSPP